MKDRVYKAVERIKGYCMKQKHCDKCRFYMIDKCSLIEGGIPCDWEIPQKPKEDDHD